MPEGEEGGRVGGWESPRSVSLVAAANTGL